MNLLKKLLNKKHFGALDYNFSNYPELARFFFKFKVVLASLGVWQPYIQKYFNDYRNIFAFY